MVTLYILETCPQFEALARRLETLTECTLETIETVEAFRNSPEDTPEGPIVVVFDGAHSDLMATVNQWHPSAVGVAISDDPKTIKGPTAYDWLCLPASDPEICSRVRTAARLSMCQTMLEDLATHDEVTNLYNRSYFMNRFEQALSLAKRHNASLTCAVLSIDGYNMYRDSYGYDFVNALIKAQGDLVAEHIRNEDVLARVGDDEIGLLLPQTDEAGARVLCERIVNTINGNPFIYEDKREELGVQIGIVSHPLEEYPKATAEDFLRYARHALHIARTEEVDNDIQTFSAIEIQL